MEFINSQKNTVERLHFNKNITRLTYKEMNFLLYKKKCNILHLNHRFSGHAKLAEVLQEFCTDIFTLESVSSVKYWVLKPVTIIFREIAASLKYISYDNKMTFLEVMFTCTCFLHK